MGDTGTVERWWSLRMMVVAGTTEVLGTAGSARRPHFWIFPFRKSVLPCAHLPVLYAAGAMAKPARAHHLPPLHQPSALPMSRPKQPRVEGSVLATHLAQHLDMSRQRIQQLVDENVIERLPSGRFDQDECRVRYLRWLRDPERRSARSQADADFIKAKTELIAIRVREKKRELIEFEEAKAVTKAIVQGVSSGQRSSQARR